MKKKKITYGIYGMMECQVVVKIGNTSKMKVLFTDGSMTASGVTPATFTTDNLMTQHAIERSPDFKNGRIKKVRSIELNEEVKIESNNTTSAKKDSEIKPLNISDTAVTEEESCGLENEQNEDVEVDRTDNLKEEDVEFESKNIEDTTEDNIVSNNEEKKVVNVTDLETAKDYLSNTFGVAKSTFRSKKSVLEFAESKNIEFVGI
ncbi:MAG: hypothetical protein E7066_06150 [Lentimicrobiaceae bacterium]|nr:hypothetical protein [Lentimicrobiaceae bacterium]